MRLGIHVNTGRHMKELVSIARAAVDRGHAVTVFVMAEGAGLLTEKAMDELAGLSGVDVSFCDYSTMEMDFNRQEIPEAVRTGSQLDNSIMVRDSDRVICL
jgi:hypothetical protein